MSIPPVGSPPGNTLTSIDPTTHASFPTGAGDQFSSFMKQGINDLFSSESEDEDEPEDE